MSPRQLEIVGVATLLRALAAPRSDDADAQFRRRLVAVGARVVARQLSRLLRAGALEMSGGDDGDDGERGGGDDIGARIVVLERALASLVRLEALFGTVDRACLIFICRSAMLLRRSKLVLTSTLTRICQR